MATGAALATAACVQTAPPAGLPAAEAGLCQPGEQPLFACPLDASGAGGGGRQVALCAQGPAASGVLHLRVGQPGRQVLARSSHDQSAGRFLATTMALRPDARVDQVWFDRGGERSLVAVCVGGGCPDEAVFARLQDGGVVERSACQAPPGRQRGFSRALVVFGPDLVRSRAVHPALRLGAYDNLLDDLFPGALPAVR